MIGHLLQIRRAAQDIFAGAEFLLVPHGLFDLTPGEARLARALAGRQSIEEISLRSAMSRETVRRS